MITRRSAFAVFTAAFAAPVAAAFAQGAPVGGTATTPGNSESTPSAGTGVVSKTQVQGTAPTTTHRRRARRSHTTHAK